VGEEAVSELRRLKGRVAVITGAAQGIGRALAIACAGEGAAVVVADRDVEHGRAVADACVQAGHTAVAAEVDVTLADSVARMVDTTISAYGQLDVLINNAALFSTIKMKPFQEISLDEWNAVIAVNLTGVFLCCRAVSAPMRSQGGGRIINMSSATALFGRPNYLHYVASKAGVVGLTRGLARELGEFGITVNALMPGSVETEIKRDSVNPDQVKQIIASQSIHRRLTPDDIVGTAVFLASAESGAISGQSIVVDGGANFL
jgi:3-oxoacyl-[acyl-carrier protein] reductase